MTTSSVPLSAIVGFTKNLRVFDSLGRSEMASCFLPAERSAVGTNSPPFFTNVGKIASLTSIDLSTTGIVAAWIVTVMAKKPSLCSCSPREPRRVLFGTSSMQTSMVGREARKFGYMKTAVAAVATAAMTENGSNTISSVGWLNVCLGRQPQSSHGGAREVTRKVARQKEEIMRWNIKGFDQYEVDETGQVWSKAQKRRFGNSCRLIPEKPLKLEKAGTWQMRKVGLPQRLRPDEIEQLKIAKGETDATHS